MDNCTFCGKPTKHWAIYFEGKAKGAEIGACGDCAGEAFNDAILALKAEGNVPELDQKKRMNHATILEIIALMAGIFQLPTEVTKPAPSEKK
jgi:hypothetical protein